MQRAAAAVAGGLGRYDACIQKDGVDNFDHCSGFVAVRAKLDIRSVFHIMGRENAGTAFAAEQDNALVKHRQTVNDTRTADDTADLALNAVEEADIDRVKAAVKLNALDINLHAQQFGCARLDGRDAAGVDQFLRIAAQVNADISQAFLAAAGVIYLFGVDTDRFAETAGGCIIIVTAADRAGAAVEL